MYTLSNPWWFFLAALPLGLLAWYIKKPRNQDELQVKNPMLEQLVKFARPQVLRHFAVGGLFLGMLVAIVLVVGFRTPASTVSSEAKEERASLCFIVFDNSGSMSYSNQAGTDIRIEEARRQLTTGINDPASACEEYGLVTFSGQSDALVAPSPGMPVDKAEVLAQLESVTPNPGGTDIAAGLGQALTQCKLGQFGPCNFLLVSDLSIRSDNGEAELLSQLLALKALGATLDVFDVGSAQGYDGQQNWARFQTPQTEVLGDPTVADTSKMVSSPTEAFQQASVQTFTVPSQDVPVPASTPVWPRLLGALLLAFLLVPFVRTIRE